MSILNQIASRPFLHTAINQAPPLQSGMMQPLGASPFVPLTGQGSAPPQAHASAGQLPVGLGSGPTAGTHGPGDQGGGLFPFAHGQFGFNRDALGGPLDALKSHLGLGGVAHGGAGNGADMALPPIPGTAAGGAAGGAGGAGGIMGSIMSAFNGGAGGGLDMAKLMSMLAAA